jgi:hypothetical protein
LNDDDRYPVTLGDLYYAKRIDLALLAKAIRHVGVWGYDRADKFCYFEAGSLYCDQALGRLARQVDVRELPEGMEPDYESDCFWHFGWPPSKLPDFQKIAKTRRQPRRSDAVRVETNALVQFASVLEVVKKYLGWTDAALIEAIGETMGDYEALSKRSLEARFAEARQAVKDLHR